MLVFKRWKELGKVWRPVERCVAQFMIDFGCISSRILWIKIEFSRVEVCVVVGYSPNEGIVEERERF